MSLAASAPARRSPLPAILLTVGLVAAAVAGLAILGSTVSNRDLNKYPAGWTFMYVFQQTPPAGIRELTAAGYRKDGKADAWLRFKATPGDLLDLTEGFQKVEVQGTAGQRKWGGVSESRLTEQDAVNVKWLEVARLEKPEVYYRTAPGREATMVVDRKSGMTYAQLTAR